MIPLNVQAAAALCVGIGSFSDPDDIPGFAHFLEHSKSILSSLQISINTNLMPF